MWTKGGEKRITAWLWTAKELFPRRVYDKAMWKFALDDSWGVEEEKYKLLIKKGGRKRFWKVYSHCKYFLGTKIAILNSNSIKNSMCYKACWEICLAYEKASYCTFW